MYAVRSQAARRLRPNASSGLGRLLAVRILSRDISTSLPARSGEELPWYLRDQVKSQFTTPELESAHIPEDVPTELKEIYEVFIKEYGLEDLKIFDMAYKHDLDEIKDDVDYVLISTGKSEKHVFNAARELRQYLKLKYNVVPHIEGMVSSAKTPAMRRRLLRRANKKPSATDNEYGKSANSWVVCTHDHAELHILTKSRREELNLESLFCHPDDAHLYESKMETQVDSDHIFSGIRRFHTLARMPQAASLLSRLQSLQAVEYPHDLKDEFDAAIDETSLNEHSLRVQFYRLLHLSWPEIVPFSEVENAILAKYTSGLGDSNSKIDDVVDYMKLLLDTPGRGREKSQADDDLDKLSCFMNTLYLFLTDNFSMSLNREFAPLLWRLTHRADSEILPAMIDLVIEGAPISSTDCQTTISSSKARDVLFLLRSEKDVILTGAMRELILLTYGNAGDWEKFWAEWEDICMHSKLDSGASVQRYVRLAIYLALRNDPAASLAFLTEHWNVSSSVAGGFLPRFIQNGRKFNSEPERLAFMRAMAALIESAGGLDQAVFDDIKDQITEL